MRKITSLLMLLCAFVGTAWAQTSELKVSTDRTNPQNVYFIKNGNNAFMNGQTCPMGTSEEPGRFAFFAVDGQTDTYKMYSVNAGKWIAYTAEIGKGKVSLVDTEDAAKTWVITLATNNSNDCYQFLASGSTDCYMNWNGGVNQNSGTTVGFWSDAASADAGSAWKLSVAATSGKFVLCEKRGMYVSLDDLGEDANASAQNQLATLISTPKAFNITVTQDGKWKIYNDDNAYLGKYGGWDSWVDTNQSGCEWTVEYVKENDEIYYILQVIAGKYLGADAFTAGSSLYTDKTGDRRLLIKLLPATLKMVQVNYSFVYDGVEKARQQTVCAVGSAYPDVQVEVPRGFTVGSKPAGSVPDEDEVTVEIEFTKVSDLPFEIFADAASISQWYFVKMHANANTTSYLKKSEDNVAWADRSVTVTEKDAYMWGFVGDAFGLKVVNKASGQAFRSTGSGNVTLADFAEATALKVNDSQAGGNWFCLKNTEVGNYINAQGGFAKHYGSNDNGSSMQVELEENVIFPVLDGWTTFYADARVVIPEGLSVYIVTEKTDNSAKLELISGTMVPANTGILLNAGESSDMVVVKTLDNSELSVTGNQLRGSVVDTPVEGNAYVLSDGNNGIGFYKAILNMNAAGEAGDTHFKNNAHRAYLPAGNVVNPVRFLNFNFDTETGIKGIDGAEDAAANTIIYDLSGRRVQSTQKGIYIINGKKIIK